jgi:hypothetical protein
MNYVQITKCRTCFSDHLFEILDLGFQPLANALKDNSSDKGEKKYPLRLVQCGDCSLVQIDVNVKPELMFSNYNWVTGTSQSSMEHCENFARRTLQIFEYFPKSVLEVGSNDGTLLKAFLHKKVKLLVGVDPAENLAREYGTGIFAENAYFDSINAGKIQDKYGKFDVIIARNVFSHVPDFSDVISGVSKLTDSDSIFLMEFHWAHDILLNLHYDSIYHEHTYYHSISSVSSVLKNYDLEIFDAFRSPISGGSVVVAASRNPKPVTPELMRMREFESISRISDYQSWEEFGKKAQGNLEQIASVIDSYSGKRICAFGASARSSTILNAIGGHASKILSVAENNPRKWGKFSPGIGLPIESVENMLSRKPDLIILFPFNFKDEIIDQLLRLGWSGSLLLPIPHPPQLIEV